MKNLRSLFIILSAVLFFTSCQKEETIEKHDSISGVLRAGEDMTAEDLNGLEIYLGRFNESVDFANITFKNTAIDSVAATTLNADGSFSFDKLAPGNYGLAMKNGFIFSLDTALCINLNGNSECIIQKDIDRLPEDNRIPPCGLNTTTPYTVYIKIELNVMNLGPTYRVKKVHCFFDSVYHTYAFDVPENENTIFRHIIYDQSIPDNSGATPEYPIRITNQEIEFEIWKYNNGVVTDIIRSPRMPACCMHNNYTPSTSWPGNDIDISWIEYSSTVTGFWPWNKKVTTIIPHYEISLHK